ncbi:MAG: hypothetical protein ISS25_02140 [Nanoarchaeota archaeon]|nr:hypothetical protein [DPANN group archaeon]MBL7116606.1 hypothetical protein [Nanoarchaeota archaeon]
MRTILFQKTVDKAEFGNFVSFNKGVMIHKQIEYRDGCVFMRMKKRRLIH